MDSNYRATADAGFTLIELLVAVTIVGILAMIAVPNYADYVKRSRIVDATSRLADWRVRMEQYFLDNRKYTAAGGGCGVSLTATGSESFQLSCEAPNDRTYTIKAVGLASRGMQEFEYWIDQNNVKQTKHLPSDWSMANAGTCWITRKDGSCG